MSLRAPGRVLLLSSYELGHAPHALALAAGCLERAGFAPRSIDLSTDKLTAADVNDARLIVFSTPMHTALRLALPVLDEIRALAPSARIAFIGHYALLHRRLLEERGASWVLAAELESQLVTLAEALDAARAPDSITLSTRRQTLAAPSRRGIDDLSRYARFVSADGARHLAGYSETTRGCLESCRHCPVPAVYGGRFVAIDAARVLEDIGKQVEAGAAHITFGDPDFLNGPTHSLRICRELHARWPALTFDFTAQVANLLEHAELTAELAELGAAFAVTAVESLSDRVLAALGKRHHAGDVAALLELASAVGLPLRPTLVPFTPWTTLEDIAALTDWVADNRLERCVAPVQMSVRLLVPPGSLLLESAPDSFGPLDEHLLGHGWQSPDPRLDALASELAALTGAQSDAGTDDLDSHDAIRHLVRLACDLPATARDPRPRPHVPRVSEPWFC